MRKTNAMVESGILAALAVVMAVVAVYIPVLGMFVNFIWPLPIIACGVRNGFKWSLLTTVVAGLIAAMIINPLQAFILVAVFGILGLVLGECMRRNVNPLTILAFGSVGAIVAMIINFAIAFLIMDINPIAMLFESFDNSLVQMADFQRAHGVAEAEIEATIASYKELIRMMRIILPGAFLITAPTLAFLNYWVAKKVLTKLGNHFQDLPPFRELVIPRWLLLPYGLSLMAIAYFLKVDPNGIGYHVTVNIQVVCSAIFMFQGLALIYWYIYTHNKPKWWGHVATFLIFIQIISFVILWLGAFDSIADFRKLRGKKI